MLPTLPTFTCMLKLAQPTYHWGRLPRLTPRWIAVFLSIYLPGLLEISSACWVALAALDSNNASGRPSTSPVQIPVNQCPVNSLFTQIHSWMNLRIATVGSVCLSVCDVRESCPEFWTEYLGVGRIIYSIHLVIRHTKPDKKIPPASFPFPVPKVEGVGKNLKISYSMIDNSAVWKALVSGFIC
jgi:hypothetical protein